MYARAGIHGGGRRQWRAVCGDGYRGNTRCHLSSANASAFHAAHARQTWEPSLGVFSVPIESRFAARDISDNARMMC